MKITKKYTPRVADLGPDGVITPGAVAEILEDAGNAHSETVALSLVEQSKTGKSFIITDWDMVFSSIPGPGEELTVETWIRGRAPSLVSVRQFLVRNDAGEEVLRAEAKIAIVELATGKPVVLDEEFYKAYGPEDEALIPSSPRPREEKDWDGSYEVIPSGAHSDFNGHLHNTKYFHLLCGVLEEGDYKKIEHVRLLYLKPVIGQGKCEVKYKKTDIGVSCGLYREGVLCSLALFGIKR